jgi:hypothetical protein
LNQVGRIGGAGLGPVTFNEMLMQWSAGDLGAARRSFALLRVHNPARAGDGSRSAMAG